MVGKTILGYHVDEKIGSGGFGTVYKVSKTNAAGTYVRALKHITLPTKRQYTSVLNSMGGDYSKADDYFASILQDIVSEINILSTLSEAGIQNIVRYYENDIVETPSPKSYDIYILMEFLTPFTDYIENNSFTVRDVISFGKDILKALKACHDKNIIHRDIKDDNIFVSSDGVYKLGDFGVSKALKDKSRAESMKGTPNFIAPEVYLGKEKYDHTVDLYSLGIVLYKLLNKSRNPFMPKYPAPYSTQDEDAAFEARMTGQTPELPICAENALGEAVLKAIMPRQNRYNNAQEFFEALEKVEAVLDDAVLSQDLGLSAPPELRTSKTPSQTFGGDMHNNETIGSDILQTNNQTIDQGNDRHLFDTIGATPVPNNQPRAGTAPVPAPAPAEPKRATKYSISNIDKDPGFSSWDSSPTPGTPPKVEAISKSGARWLLYLAPLLIVAQWVFAYLVIIPVIYNKGIDFIEWFTPGKFIEALKDSRNVMYPLLQIIILRLYNWLTLAGLITSLFFIGRSLQYRKPEQNVNAKLHGNEPYILTMGLLEEIKLVQGADITRAAQAVKLLNERLRNESAFGEGNDAVANCENEIAANLDKLQRAVPGLRDTDSFQDATESIEILCQRSMAKLKVRIELKKR